LIADNFADDFRIARRQMLHPEARLAGDGQHRGPDRADNPRPGRRNRLIGDRRAFEDRIFQIVIATLRYFQPRVLVDGVQLVALPPGGDLAQVPDIVADRRRKEIPPADAGADHDPGMRKLLDRSHVEVKEARKALPGYALGHSSRFRDLFFVWARSFVVAPYTPDTVNQKEYTTMDYEKTSYSNKSNARRAARKAGLSEFDVYKASDNWYKIRAPAAKATKPTKAAKLGRTLSATKPHQLVDESERDRRKIAKLTAMPTSKRAAVLAAAQAGKLPPPLDFSAPTHARYRDAAKELGALAKAGNVEALKAMTFKTYSSSPKAMAKYRDLAVIALEARRDAA
jgi:hypothetical protein